MTESAQPEGIPAPPGEFIRIKNPLHEMVR